MDFTQVITYVEENDLFLKEKDFYEIPIGARLPLIGLDYLEFLAAEYSLAHDIKPDVIYDPAEFFDRFVTFVVRHAAQQFGVESEFDGVFVKDANWRHEHDTQYMVTGSGDGYTRYVILPVAKQLPKFFFDIDPDSLQYQQEMKEVEAKRWDMERNKFLQKGSEEEKKFVTEFPTYDLVKLQLPIGHRNYHSMKHTVRQAIRHRNGVKLESFEERQARIEEEYKGEDEYPMTDSDDEWDIQKKAKLRIEKDRKWEEGKQKYMQNGTDLEKRLVNLPKETLENMIFSYQSYFEGDLDNPEEIISFLMKNKITDPNIPIVPR